MNERIRVFAWGLFLVLVCGFSVYLHVSEMCNGVWEGDWLDIFLLSASIVGASVGLNEVDEAINW